MHAREGFAALLVAFSLSAEASTWSFADLPDEIQGCLGNGTCLLTPTSNADFGNASFFDFASSPTSQTPVFQQLIRYELTPPSATTRALSGAYEGVEDDFASSTLGGAVWLLANESYDLSAERHAFTLYLDRVSPTPDNLWAWQDHPLTKNISVSTAELLAGQGHYSVDVENDYATAGSLLLHAQNGDGGYPYLSCIECSVAIDFNLIGLQYQSFQTNTAWLSTNPQDMRTLLYSESSYQHEGSYYGSQSQTFYVATVPEASTWTMLLAGVGLVGWAVRRRSRP